MEEAELLKEKVKELVDKMIVFILHESEDKDLILKSLIMLLQSFCLTNDTTLEQHMDLLCCMAIDYRENLDLLKKPQDP